MGRYVIDLQLFSKKLCTLMIKKGMVYGDNKPDPIALYNALYPSDKIEIKNIIGFNRSDYMQKVRKQYNWINGNSYPKNITDILELCNALDCDLDFLFTDMVCKTHDKQFIHNRTGLSETAIDELEQLHAETAVYESSQYDLNIINALIEQLNYKNHSIIHWITTYLRSKGLKKDLWYYTESGTISTQKYISVEPVIHMDEKSDIFDNLILMGLQNHIKALKDKLTQ